MNPVPFENCPYLTVGSIPTIESILETSHAGVR